MQEVVVSHRLKRCKVKTRTLKAKLILQLTFFQMAPVLVLHETEMKVREISKSVFSSMIGAGMGIYRQRGFHTQLSYRKLENEDRERKGKVKRHAVKEEVTRNAGNAGDCCVCEVQMAK